MLRPTIFTTSILVLLALGSTASPTRADGWDDYQDRLEDLREERREQYEDWLEERRERYEDWLDDLEDAREDYYDDLEDRRRFQNQPRFYHPRRGYFRGAPFQPGFRRGYRRIPPHPGYWNQGGFSLRGPYGGRITIRW